jgi:hypothetical protein
MSNDIILAIKNQLPIVQTGLDEDTKAVAGSGLGGASKRISIKGGVFRKIVGGKEVAANEDRHMEIVFVKMAHNASRNFYSQGYQEGAKVSPSCWSSDGRTPDPEVKSPCASSCSACPNSVKGSGYMGKGTACRLSWRTAVVLPNDPSGDVMQLILPPTSCFGDEENGRWPFKSYVQMLASNNISAGRVITRMSFDTKSPVPRLLFQPVSAVPEVAVETIIRQSKSSAAENAVRMNVYQSDEAAPAVAEPVGEPEVRTPSATATPADPSDLIRKWGNKKSK